MATQELHRLTAYTDGWWRRERSRTDAEWTPPVDDPRIISDLRVNDLSRLPWFYKRYPATAQRLPLPPDLPATADPAMAVLAGTASPPATRLDAGHLARILHLSAGVTRTAERPYGRYLFRAAGSAGGRFPLEVYVAIPDGHQLPPGVFCYDPLEHELVRVGPPPVAGDPTVIMTGIPWRTGWRYRERGYRHVYWDVGTMLAQLLAAADSAGIPAALYLTFPDALVAALVGADGRHEWPVALVTLGEGSPALVPGGPALAGAVDHAPVEFPLITRAQHAGDRDRLGPPIPRGPAVAAAIGDGAPLEAVALRRGSQRRMDPTARLPSWLLHDVMAVATRGVGQPQWVVVNRVDAREPGLYGWPDLATPIRAGDLREEIYRVSVDQALTSDAAFVVISADEITALDDREYREAHLVAGLVEGRLHLAAYALGASASGMTFLDSAIPGLLGQPLDGLLLTCVGVPDYVSAPGGPPGRPTPIRMVRPRGE